MNDTEYHIEFYLDNSENPDEELLFSFSAWSMPCVPVNSVIHLANMPLRGGEANILLDNHYLITSIMYSFEQNSLLSTRIYVRYFVAQLTTT